MIKFFLLLIKLLNDTISEKANLIQLYQSWKDLSGQDPRIQVYYDDCIKLPSIPDEENEE